MKIIIIGSNGSGKSTFARKLGEILDLPVYHLDYYYWKPGWQETPPDEWNEFIRNLVQEDQWIIDGYYGKTLDMRLEAADVVVFMDLSPWVTTYRVIKRRIQYNGRSRPDLNEGCPESIDWPFIKYSWNFRRDKRPAVMEKLKKYSLGKKIIIIKNPKQAESVLYELRTRGRSDSNALF
ncbi:DNA topology modulation protein [Paenibacillus sp. D2_2]|uniref:DNA topology modulation protein n=1 Tax=Paenibacillus sp. D2_2 TaxID=3073092 RepID=UPI0028153B22|nr:DNA topology modulation protein [Paenibacillus sp. D2_2]WMT38899.1 DNA topology modulation protein [Paenibacillus sp. D2_2]